VLTFGSAVVPIVKVLGRGGGNNAVVISPSALVVLFLASFEDLIGGKYYFLMHFYCKTLPVRIRGHSPASSSIDA